MGTKICLLITFGVLTASWGYSQWPRDQGVYTATSSNGIPAFPSKLSKYRFVGQNLDFWGRPFRSNGKLRVSEGGSWTSPYDGHNDANFPNTMNNCGDGVFMIRWRTGNPNVKVWSALGYDEAGPVTRKSKLASSYGYVYGSNCEEPLFTWGKNTVSDGGNLVDVYYELRFWEAAP